MGGCECGWVGVLHASMHENTHVHIYTQMLNKLNMDASMEVAICGF